METTQLNEKSVTRLYVDQSMTWNKVLNSSVILMKKAISSYNNLLNNERIEDFITYFHISFLRLSVAYFKKINKSDLIFENGKIIGFQQIIGLLKRERFFDENESSYVSHLNDLRNALFHYDIEKTNLTTSRYWYTFFNGLILLWEKLKSKLDGTILTDNILVLSTYELIKNDSETNDFYFEKLKDIQKNPVWEDAHVLTMKLYDLSKDYLNNKNDQKLTNAAIGNKITFGNLLKALKSEITGFNQSTLICLNKVFSINLKILKSGKNQILINETYAFMISDPDAPSFVKVKYRAKYLEKIIFICNGNKLFNDFFRYCSRKEKKFNIENFDWSNEEVKIILDKIKN